jgi:hypothetical protein
MRFFLPFAFASIIATAGASGAELPPLKSCLTPMTNDEKPVAPRDLVVARSGDVVVWSLCYVSDQVAIADMNVQLSGFDGNGALISLNGQSRGFLPRTNRSSETPPDAPPIVDTASVTWTVPANVVLSDYFLIALQWAPCKSPPTGTACEAGPRLTSTFLRKIRTARPRARRR